MTFGLRVSEAFKERAIKLRTKVARFLLLPDLAGEVGKELRTQVRSDGVLTPGYMLMCGLSAGIATFGLLQSSVAVVIGAMLVSPLMSPIVALGFGFSSFDGERVREATKVVVIGALIGVVTALLITWLSPIRNATPEIIARTQPTLLDLGVAILSGVAGGYAVVKQMGATAIGVAIATALMPPLATVGYGVGTMQWNFAGGALLLFLTNLAAIAFSISLVARLSGASRPLRNVQVTPMYFIFGTAAFLALATPLALTLVRVTQEAKARSVAQSVLTQEFKIKRNNIAQLDVSWPLGGALKIDAVIISLDYKRDVEETVVKELASQLDAKPALNLQQIVAADIGSQTRAIVNSAMERTSLGIANDVPPFDKIRAALGIPVQSIWTDRAERIVNIVPTAVVGWTLSDYRDAEQLAAADEGDWKVRIIPPSQQRILVSLIPEPKEQEAAEQQPKEQEPKKQGAVPAQATQANAIDPAVAIWAIQRWGLRNVTLPPEINEPSNVEVTAPTARKLFESQLSASGINFTVGDKPSAVEANSPTSLIADQAIWITVYGATPKQRATLEAGQ